MRGGIPVRSMDSFEPESAASALTALSSVGFAGGFSEKSARVTTIMWHVVYLGFDFF